MTGDELRQAFLDFFAGRGHLILPSAPLVPEDDPSLLWINAGMAPFKPYFNGTEKPPRTRIATSQKCIRTNDIENVGKTARHHTFFEMLGNFSFGDYFKEEAIAWAWEFVTEVLALEEEKLWITIYRDDDEAFGIWHDKIGIPGERIVRMGKKENFWQIGTGPCGPCSEIHYDRGPAYGTGPEDTIEGEGERFLEIWNLVFTQYDYTEEGEYLNLPSKNIDTGMGLERVASLLQGVDSNFETDFFRPIINFVSEDTGINYKKNEEVTTAYRVIADHIRGITMAIHDGVLPSNEGRGYIIRRLLRRAVRYGGKLGYEEPFLHKIVPSVVGVMEAGYPEVSESGAHIQSVVEAEEDRFFQTLDQGLQILNEMIDEMAEEGNNVLTGSRAFKLYDTYGFPLDLTKDVLAEEGYEVDEEGFAAEMEKQRARARRAREETDFSGNEDSRVYGSISDRVGKSEFIGYRNLEVETEVVALVRDGKEIDSLREGEEGAVILRRTPFYAESGGQVGDTGLLGASNIEAEVIDTAYRSDLIVHRTRVVKGKLERSQSVKAIVRSTRRKDTARNHTATHLVHQVLREELGDHVQQSGSLVTPGRLRFDFSHYSSLDAEELERIEDRVNEKILDNIPAETLETTVEKAKDMGATALFTEAYGSQVRVVKIGNFSIELCGGTHVDFTGDIGLFKITGESGTAAGIRRIEAVTGHAALAYVKKAERLLDEAGALLKTEPGNLVQRIEGLLEKQGKLEKEISSLTDKLANFKSQDLLDRVEEVKGVQVLTAEVNDMDNEGLRNLADELKNKLESGIIVLASALEGKVIFVAAVTEDLVAEGYHAGEMIGKVAQITGGGGGGRPDMAQAGGSKTGKIGEALAEVNNLI